MAIQWHFASVADHGSEVQTFAQTLQELRDDMLNKAQALVGDGAYTGNASSAFLAAFTHMSAQSQHVIDTVRNYGLTIVQTGHTTQLVDQSETTRFC